MASIRPSALTESALSSDGNWRVADFRQGAATNVAALPTRQRRDRARVRVKTDLPPELKESAIRVRNTIKEIMEGAANGEF